MPSEENNRHRRTEFAQAILQLRTAQFRYPHVEEDAARDTFVRQTIQQRLGRSIGRDLVTGSLQTTLYRCPEGRIVVDYVYEPLHGLSPENRPYDIKQLQPENVDFMGFVRLLTRCVGKGGSESRTRTRWTACR
jgi:hypothetical protein